MRRIFIVGAIFVASVMWPAYADAILSNACNAELANSFKIRCMSAHEADDKPSQLIYCAHAAEEVGVCVEEASGVDRLKDINIKTWMYEYAAMAAIDLKEMDKTRAYLDAAISGATILAGPNVPHEYSTGMATLLHSSRALKMLLFP